MTAPEKENLMMKDQARTQARKLAKRKPFPVGLLFFPAIILVFALIAFGLYLYLDREIENSKREEFENAKKEFENTPAPQPGGSDGRKLFFIWECELYEYDVDSEQSKLISSEVSGFKDVACFENEIFTNKQEVIVSKTESEVIDGIYFFDFDSSSYLSKLGISAGADLNAFAFNSSSKTIFQAIKRDAIYSINSETKEVKKVIDNAGFDPARDTDPTDEFSLSLSPDGISLLNVDSISVKYDPEDLNAPNEEYLSIRVFDLNGKVVDSTVGTFARWIDSGRIVYWPHKKTNAKVTIRTLKSKVEIGILPGSLGDELQDVIALAVDPTTSLIAATYAGVDLVGAESDPETHIYDNSLGTTNKLSSFLLKPEFFLSDFLVGYSTDGVAIYDLKTNENKIIIGK